MIKCRAAVLPGVGQPLVIEDINVAPPKRGEIRVKLGASGVCGTDVHVIHGSPALPARFPCILGHEGCGVVESIGECVTKVAPGDRVLLHYLMLCGKCRLCIGPKKTNFCPVATPLRAHVRPIDGETRFSRASDGTPIFYFFGLSTFSEYTVVGDDSLVKIDPVISRPLKDETLCLLGCGVSTGYGAALNIANVLKGTRVGVWGLGPVGLSAIQGARNRGAIQIIGIDLNEDRFEMARKLGATECINPNKLKDGPGTLAKHLIEMTDGGLDHAIECAGSQIAAQSAFDSLFFEGRLTIIGAGNPKDSLKMSVVAPLYGKSIVGGTFGGFHEEDIDGLVREVLNGQLLATEYITLKVSLDDAQKAVHAADKGSGIKSVILYS